MDPATAAFFLRRLNAVTSAIRPVPAILGNLYAALLASKAFVRLTHFGK